MKRCILILFLFICSLLPCPVFAQQHDTVPNISLLQPEQYRSVSPPNYVFPAGSGERYGRSGIIDSLYVVLKTAKEDTDKVNVLNNLAWEVMSSGDYSKADSLAENALQLAEKLDFKKGQANAYNDIGVLYYEQGDYPNALKADFAALKAKKETGDKPNIAASYNNIGLVYYEQGDYPNALKNYINALKISEDLGDRQVIASSYNNIGLVYWQQGDYSNALKNYSITLKMNEEIGSKRGIGIAYGNMGGIYFEQGNYPEALKNLLQSLKISEEIGNKKEISKAYGNMGVVFENEGNYPESLKNYLQGLKIAEEINNKNCINFDYINMGSLFIKQKRYAEAKKYLDSALFLSKFIGNKDGIKDTYTERAQLDSAMVNYKAAYNDYKMYITYRDSLKNEENTKRIVREQMNYEFDKKMAAEKAEQEKTDIIRTAERTKERVITYSIIIILALTLISAILLIKSQQIKRKKDKIERVMLKIEKQHVEDELLNAKKALGNYTKSMAEKNELLEQFKIDTEKLKNLKSKELEDIRIEQLEHLNKTTILTEDDWDKFKELFEQVYKGFLIRLKEKLPDLSQAEIRLICLTKLRLDAKQMANILGVSRDAIGMTRLRLRKKLGLAENKDIEEIIENI